MSTSLSAAEKRQKRREQARIARREFWPTAKFVLGILRRTDPTTVVLKVISLVLNSGSWALFNTYFIASFFDRLEAGEAITIPHFNFMTHDRDPQGAQVPKPEPDDFVIFEGLHALNPLFTARHPNAYRIYVQPMTDVVNTDGNVVFSHTWNRLMRRCVRDVLHRNASVAATLAMWASVRRGELSYICPYMDTANFTINTSHDYEIPVLGHYLTPHVDQLSQNTPEFDTIQAIVRALPQFVCVDPGLVSTASLLREEFI